MDDFNVMRDSDVTRATGRQEETSAGLRDCDGDRNTDDESLESVDAILSTIDEICQSIVSPTLEEKQCGGTATFGNSDDVGWKVDGIEWVSATERDVSSPLNETQCGRCLPSPRKLY